MAYALGKLVTVERLYKGRVTVHRTGVLMLENVSMNDSGSYRCEMHLRDGIKIHHTFRLNVGVPPVIRPFSFPVNIEILEDSDLMIPCYAVGKPPPAIFWSRPHDSRGRLPDYGHRLEIIDAKPSDSGLYYCYASNYMDVAERTVRIHVYERPRVTSFFNSAALDGTIYECETVRFTCESLGGELPVETYRFYHNGREITRGNEKDGQFAISKVRRKHDGTYCCVPVTRLGLGTNGTIDLKVKAAPEICKRRDDTYQSTSTSRINTTSSTVGLQSVPQTGKSKPNHHGTGRQLHASLLVTVLLLAFYFMAVSDVN